MFALLTSQNQRQNFWYSVITRAFLGKFLSWNSGFFFFVQLQITRCRLALKNVLRFRNGSVRKTYERSLYGRTFINKPSSRNMLYQLNYPMLIERSINANPMVYVDVFFSKCLIHFFQSIHDNDIFEVREV